MKLCTSGVSEALGGAATIGEGASGAKVAGEEPQAGVRSPEWSRAGAGSGVRGRKGRLEVPAPLGRAWGLPRSPARDTGDSVGVSGGIWTLSSVSRKGCSLVMRP